MIHELINPNYKPSSAAALLERVGKWDGHTVDWSSDTKVDSLTLDEIKALQAKHGTNKVNLSRAQLVKTKMLEGKKQAQIIRDLKGHGHGYGERMIKADHAALSVHFKKEAKKGAMKPLHL